MKKLLLSTALAAGIGAFALQPTTALADGLDLGGEGELGLTGEQSLALGIRAVQVLQPWGPLEREGRTQFFGNTYPNAEEDSPSVTVTAWVQKDKDKRILELIAKLKVAVILVARVFRGNSAAESDLVVEQENTRNSVDTPGTGDDPLFNRNAYVTLNATLRDSVNRNSGIVEINQDAGNMANQANMLSAAVGGEKVTFADAQSAAEQINAANRSRTVEAEPPEFTPANAQKQARIVDSINVNAGVVLVNQNVGNMNNQLNGVSLAVGISADFALADALLGQFNTGNRVVEVNTIKTNTIARSVNGNSGIVGVNQATGNMNNQATMISFAGAASLGSTITP